MERALFVTPLYAGLLALWFLVLSWRVIQRRGKGTWLGDGGDQALPRLIPGPPHLLNSARGTHPAKFAWAAVNRKSARSAPAPGPVPLPPRCYDGPANP